ncbi:hypothetical protein RNJ44_02369 [Nakaseomyces bracarensis]|uniref:Ubiquitin carboxyl-terminal hydrolase n=1 Tax=Nakaseomyces bracarensis TaxID=273131 RepID=A0ABR4NN84_9SACH
MLKKWLPSSKKKQNSNNGKSAPVTPIKDDLLRPANGRSNSTISKSVPNNNNNSNSNGIGNGPFRTSSNTNEYRKDSFGNIQSNNIKLGVVEPPVMELSKSNLSNNYAVLNSSEESLPHELQEHATNLDTEKNELIPYGDGSNKVFGYENFGNTCYCNSVLQCLYNLPEFRLNILAYPENPNNEGRKRKTEMLGLRPKYYTEEQFENRPGFESNRNQTFIRPSNSAVSVVPSVASNNAANNKPIFSLNSSDRSKSNLPTANNKVLSGQSTERLQQYPEHSKSQDNIIGVSQGVVNPSDDNLVKRVRSNERGNPNSILQGAESCSKEKVERIHTKKVIVGRNYPTTFAIEKSQQILENSIHLKSEHLSNEQRKKSALINGPIINIDHKIDESTEEHLYNGLKDIFECITEHSQLTGIVSPTAFIEMLKRENVLFSSMMHQDAHEFLNFLLNELSDYLDKCTNHDIKSLATNSDSKRRNSKTTKNFVNDLFQGTLTNRIKCLTCDNVTARDEPFLDFPIEVQDDEEIDIQSILQSFHQKEMLQGPNKFYCDECCGLQEAERVVGLKQLPKTLALHLKRFKYSEQQNSNIKLFNKIYYPLELNVCSTFNPSISKRYELAGIVVHMGGGPQHGHYISLCKHDKFGWLLFDDETIEAINESSVLQFTGDATTMSTAYVLFYKEIGETADKADYEKNINSLIEYDDWLRTKSPKIIKEEEDEDEEPSPNEVNIPNNVATSEPPIKIKPEIIVQSEPDKEKKSKSTRRKSRLFSFMRS